MTKKVTAVLALTVIFFFVQSHVILALSMGPITLKSKPGERFRAVVPIELDPTESADALKVSLGTGKDYSLIGETMPEGINKIHVALLREGGIKALLYSDVEMANTDLNIVLKALLDGGAMLKKYSLHLGQNISKAVGITEERTLPQTYGPIKSGETLSGIANKLGFRGPDLKKAIVAIWLNNKAAFISTNLHGLKKGALLHIANLDQDIIGISPREAHFVIGTQWEEWQKITQARAATVKMAKANRALKPAPPATAPVKPTPTPQPVKEAPKAETIAAPVVEKSLKVAATAAPFKEKALKAEATIPPRVEELAALPAVVEPIRPEPALTAAIASTSDTKPAQATAYLTEIERLHGEMKRISSRLNNEIFMLQDRLREQIDVAQASNNRLFLLFYAFVSQNIILMAVLILSRSFAELERTGALSAKG
jgi:hypothetical protein